MLYDSLRPFSVYPSRKYIYRYKKACCVTVQGCPRTANVGLSLLIPVCFWKSKTLHYISRKEETTWGNKTRLEKITCYSKKRSQLLNNLYAMCRQLFMKDSHQSHNMETAQQSFSTGYGWYFLDGHRWSVLAGSHRTPCCLWLAVPCCLYW